ncbi:MAG TPA: universal stress protein [Anaerolineales bacterium]|nr:universal stress protein [Anaerolineales bacterium]
MFEKIIVTLDGSRLAEEALEPAFDLAQAFEGEVILLRVVMVEEAAVAAGMGVTYYDIREAIEKHGLEEAEAYLKSIEAQWRSKRVRIRSEAVPGTPAEMIVETAKRLGAGVIVMSTHGRAGLGRLIYGSVAEAVLRAAIAPVLLIPVKVR